MSRVAGRRSDIVEIDGDMVRRLRSAAGNRLSQEALARRAGVSSSLIGHVETGYTVRVSREIVEAIAGVLKASPHTLIRGAEDGKDARIQASLDRISSMVERLLYGDGTHRVAGLDGEASTQGTDVELFSWAAGFMRENSRRVPVDRPVPPPEHVASLPSHEKVEIGFDLTALPGAAHARSDVALYHGWTNVACALIDALQEGTRLPPTGDNKTVLFTYQGHDLFAVVAPELRLEWLRTLCGALDNGWNVLHLLRYPALTRRYLDITSQAVELAGRTGRYLAKYVAHDPDSSTDFDLLVIPGCCAFQLWSTEAGSPPDAGLRLADPEIQRQMAAVFRKSASAASVLLDTYPQYTALLRVLLHSEQVPGDRFQIKPGPAAATVPKGLWRWAARQLRESLEASPARRGALDLVDQYERAMIKRSILLDRSLASYSSYNLMTSDALDDLVQGRYDRNDWLIVRAQEMQPDKRVPAKFRVEHLERLIELLDCRQNFHLGIADAVHLDEPFPQNQLTVRIVPPPGTKSAAFVQVWPESPGGKREEGFYAVFRESRTIAGFHQYFIDQWNDAAAITDRARVREILRRKIRDIEREDGSGVGTRRRQANARRS